MAQNQNRFQNQFQNQNSQYNPNYANVGYYNPADVAMERFQYDAQNRMPLDGLQDALTDGFGRAAALSSANMQAKYYPMAMVEQERLRQQTEQMKQQGLNQRFGPMLQLFAGALGHGGSAGGGGGFTGFTSNFGQSVKP